MAGALGLGEELRDQSLGAFRGDQDGLQGGEDALHAVEDDLVRLVHLDVGDVVLEPLPVVPVSSGSSGWGTASTARFQPFSVKVTFFAPAYWTAIV